MKFEVKERVVRIAEDCAVIGDNADYTAEFAFDSEWDGVTKTARFMKDGKYIDVLLEDDKCDIPVEVLKRGKVTVGVYSAKMTTTGVSVVVAESVKEKTGNAIDPTPNVYEQLTGKLDAIQAELPEVVAEHFNEHKDELKGDKGDKGDTGAQGEKGDTGEAGHTPTRGVDYWTEEDQKQVKTDLLASEEIQGAIADAKDAKATAQNIYANALKGTANGEVVRVDDVSPVEHTAKVRVAGKNLFNIKKIETNAQIVVDYDGETITTQGAYGNNTWLKLTDFADVEAGKLYTLSFVTTCNNEFIVLTDNKGGAIFEWHNGETHTFTQEEIETHSRVYFYGVAGEVHTISKIQIEEGDTATEYTPYINPEGVTVTAYGTDEANAKTYTPATDGTLEIPSIAPSMTITADKAVNIDVEYNKDINAVINGILEKLQ